MNILLSNDDGYNAYGINLLKEKLSKYGNVFIVAPEEAMSAKSCSITLNKGIKVINRGNNVYSLNGTPADCVAFGLANLNINFDLVVSGCNHGFNISYDTMYSGTVACGLEAIAYRKPSIAFSCDSNFEIVDKYFDSVISYIFDRNILSTSHMLNVNFPLGNEVKDIKISKLYYRKDHKYFISSNNEFFATREVEKEINDIESDCYMINHATVSITPLSGTYFNIDLYNTIKNKC